MSFRLGPVEVWCIQAAAILLAGNGSPGAVAGGAESIESSREYLVTTWQAEDGLPQNSVTCLLQDRKGYLWLGTLNGLARFDGVHFRVFDADNTPQLKSSRITCLCEDQEGGLWVGTEGGGAARLFEGKFSNSAAGVGLAHPVVQALQAARNGEVWAATLGGLCRWWEGGIGLVNARAPNNEAVSGVAVDKAGMVWTLAGGRLHSVTDGTFSLVSAPADAPPLGGLFADREGGVWAYGPGLWRLAERKHLTNVLSANDLTGQHITAMCESRAGDLWLGTRAGDLLRVHSGQISRYSAGRGPSRYPVRSLLMDREGNLWAGTDGGGVSRLKTRSIVSFTSQHGLLSEVVTGLAEDGEGGLWVGTKCGGLHRWKDGRFTPFENASGLHRNLCVGPLLRARDGSLWVGTLGEGLFRLREGKTMRYGFAEGLTDAQVLALCEDLAGTVWVGTYEGGLYRSHGGHFIHLSETDGFPGKIISGIVQQQNGTLWIGTGGTGVFRLSGGRVAHFTREQGLSSDAVRTLYVDATDALWVGASGGLSRFDPVLERFVTLHTHDGLGDDAVSQILLEELRHYFWLGGNRGLRRVSAPDLYQFTSGKRNTVRAVPYGRAEGMEGLECTGGFHPSGLRTPDGRLWFATLKGLVQVTPFAMTLPGISADLIAFGNPRLHLRGDPRLVDLADLVGGGNGFGTGSHQGIHPVSGHFTREQDLILVDRGFGGAARYHRTASPFIDGVFIPDGGAVAARRVMVSSTGLEVDLPDTTGEAWGLINRFTLEPNPWYRQRRETLAGVNYSAPEHSVLNLSGNQGVTFDLAAIRRETGCEIERFTAVAGNGWIGPAAFWVFLDGLLVAHEDDVFKDLDRPTANTYALDIPVPSQARFLTLVATDDKDNPRFFNSVPPPVVIETASVDGTTVLEDGHPVGSNAGSDPHPPGVRMRPGQERLEIRYTALSFVTPEKVRFRHRLEGFDSDWVEAGTSRVTRYARLPPGDYRFRVTACNNEEVWSETGATLAITVVPPLWRTWWFIGAMALTTAGAVGGSVRFVTLRKVQRKLERLRQQHALECERTRIARDMHDEIGAKLTKISFLSELAKRDLECPRDAERDIDRVSDTARQVIKSLDEIVWAVDPKNDRLENMATYLCRYAGDYFHDTPVQCEFDIPARLPHVPLSTDLRHNLFLTVKEALNNVLKHAGATLVCLRIRQQPEGFEVIVEDNGRGFSPDRLTCPLEGPESGAPPRKGHGLENMRQRLASVGGRCAIQSQPGCGAQLRFYIPFNEE